MPDESTISGAEQPADEWSRKEDRFYDGIYIAWGPPGTGKTTFLSAQVRAVVDRLGLPTDEDCPVLVCSLTRTAAAEIAGRDLPIPRWAVGTLHAHAYRSIGRPEVAEGHLADWNKACESAAYQVDDGSESGTADMDEPGWDRGRSNSGGVLLQRYSLLRARQTRRDVWPVRVRAFADAWEQWKADAEVVDFSDMIEIALNDCPTPPGGPQVVIADEAQDLSSLEFALLQLWGRTAGALIIAGDPWQALYTWRGAHPEAFDDPDVPANHRRVLSQSYRVPKAVHQVAMRWVKRQLSTYQEIEYRPRDAEGEVLTTAATIRNPLRVVRLAADAAAAGQTVMITASCGYMLKSTLMLLRRMGIPFSNPWRRRRGDWNPLGSRRNTSMAQRVLDFLRADRGTRGDEARAWTTGEMAAWINPLRAAGTILRGGKGAIKRIADEDPDRLLSLAETRGILEPSAFHELMTLLASRDTNFTDGTGELGPLLAWWRDRLLPSRAKIAAYPLCVAERHGPAILEVEPRLFVGTIHSFKGAEADLVILFPDLSPAGMQEWSSQDKIRRDGVVRLFYVGITRARERLVLCQPASTLSIDIGWHVRSRGDE